MAKNVVIIGAGYAGVETALSLNKHREKENVNITLIDKNSYHTLLTELHEVAGNRVSEDAIKVPLGDIFRYTSVKVVKDEITDFNFEEKKVSSANREYDYDYLVMAMGSSPNFFGIPGLKENGFTLWSYDDAIKIRDHIGECFQRASAEEDEIERKKLLTFVVGGAGFTGVEMIGELAWWTKSLAKEYSIKKGEVRLIIADMLPTVLNCLSTENAQKAHKYMEKKLGIEVLLNTRITEVTGDGFSTEDSFIGTKTLIWAAGVTACAATADLLIERNGGSRRIKVDEFLRSEHENVYVAGDLSGLTDENGVLYPAMVENAVQTAKGAANNILRDIKGSEQEEVRVKMHGTMVSVGNYYTVAEIMGKNLPVFLAIIMKYLVNMHYLFEIIGFRGVGRYLYHEVLERKQRKLIVEKHWSTRMQAWWLVPLRLFLGGVWLNEGIKKVTGGWLTNPKIASFLGMAADATTGATAAGEYVARYDDVFNMNLGILNFLIGKESRLVDGITISSNLFAKIQLFKIAGVSPVDWFLRNVVLASDGTSMFFQILVVILEIGFGLMLIGGAFSFIAALGSIGLISMFITSTGIFFESWWMVFAAIAIMGGAGRAFGLDYYIMPYLNNVVEYYRKNRKLKLFFKGSFDRLK